MNFGIAINDGYGNRCENTKKDLYCYMCTHAIAFKMLTVLFYLPF